MNRHDQVWPRLVTAARRAPAAPDAEVPFGFATRVAALGLAAQRSNPWNLLEKFALRGLLAATACSLAAIVFSYSASSGTREDESLAAADSVSELLSAS